MHERDGKANEKFVQSTRKCLGVCNSKSEKTYYTVTDDTISYLGFSECEIIHLLDDGGHHFTHTQAEFGVQNVYSSFNENKPISHLHNQPSQ